VHIFHPYSLALKVSYPIPLPNYNFILAHSKTKSKNRILRMRSIISSKNEI